MSFFSRLFGKGKQEKQKELDPLPKQEELIEEDINYAEENEKRLKAGGISPEYFYRIFKENFPQYLDLCQYFEHKKLKGYADFFNSSSSFCCGVI